MPQNEIITILTQYKDSIWLIITWFAGSITHIFNKIRKWEKLTFWQHISHLIISWFVWYMAYLVLQYLWIIWPMQWIIIGISSYSAIQIIDTVDMFKAKYLYTLITDFIKFKLWKKD